MLSWVSYILDEMILDFIISLITNNLSTENYKDVLLSF